MLFSGSLLNRFISINDTPENIANHLTLKTCEIEEIRKREIPLDVVIGFVVDVKKHENADKLNIVQVNCGNKGDFQIVTGGTNIKQDSFVPVAIPGSFLPAVDLKIVPRNMRGIDSSGMICSKNELGIPEDLNTHGIWLLEEDMIDIKQSDIGLPLITVYPWLDNFVFDIDNKTLTNRPDLTGHFGQSVELFAIYRQFQKNTIRFDSIQQTFRDFYHYNILEVLENSKKSKVDLQIDTKGCRSYLMVELNNVEIKKSSLYQRLQLLDLGSQSKNNFVDFTNLFMNIYGQPIHFFDADKIRGKMIVRNAVEGEEFIDLLGNKQILGKDDIVIADDEKINALGGIIGGKESAVTEYTKNILIEMANFDDVQVRKTGVRLNLRTDAEIRFEKNINPAWSLYCLIFLLDSLKTNIDINGEVGGLKYHYCNDISKYLNKTIEVDLSALSSFVGCEIKDEDATNILTNIGFKIQNHNKNIITTAPLFRGPDDINIVQDIYEEIIRIYGYEHVNGKSLFSTLKNVPFQDEVKFTRNIEDTLVKRIGLDQIETYSWFDQNILEKLGLSFDQNKLWKLKNCIAPENSYLRENFIYNHLGVLEKNFRSFDHLGYFEIGNIYSLADKEELSLGICTYSKENTSWQNNLLLSTKNYINIIIDEIKIKGNLEIIASDEDNTIQKLAHPKQCGNILLNKQNIGYVFALNPYYYQYFKFPQNSQISFAYLNINKLIELNKTQKVKAIQNINYNTLEDQIVQRDLSFTLNKSDNYGKIISSIKKVKEVIEINIFDLYDLNTDTKSLSLTMSIKGEKMTNDDINKIMDKAIVNAEKTGAKLRTKAKL